MTSYLNPFTSQTISPSQVGYESLNISVDTVLAWPVNGNNTDVVANIIEVTATVSNLKLILPPATEVSVGQSVLVRNIGSLAFTVTDTSSNTIISIASGLAEYIYLTNNSTINGVWTAVTFGAGTSAANAADLAGYGLVAQNTTLNQAYPVTGIFSDYLILPSNRAAFLVWEGGAGTMTLPVASTVQNNWFVMIRNGGTGILNVTCQGSSTLDGLGTFQLQIDESFVVCCTGSDFNSFGYGQSANFFFTQLVKNVTGGVVTLTQLEAQSLIQQYQGVLTSNCTVILPPTVQLYSLQNNTTGAFTLKFSTGAVGATTVTLAQNQSIVVICDGTNVYSAQTSNTNVLTFLTLNNGSATAPSLNFAGSTNTGLYLPATGQLGIASGGTNVATFTPTGLVVPSGINAGAF